MTKEETKQKLRKSGYNVIDDNSVVTVVIAPEESMKKVIRDVKDKLNLWGYNSSFAIRQQKGAGDFEKDMELEDELEDEVEESLAEEDLAAEAGDEEKSVKAVKEPEGKADSESLDNAETSDDAHDTVATKETIEEDEYYDDEDSDMLLTEDSIQFSLEDFGLDF